MSCSTCPTTSCTCCHVPNVTIDNNLTVGNSTTLNTCGNTGGALVVNKSSSCSQISGDLVAINGESGLSALNVTAGTVAVAESITCQSTISCTTLTETSDARMKTDVQPLTNALQMVQQLKGVRFKWKDQVDTKGHVGLLAQDVQQVLPDVVYEKDGTLAVSYTNIVAVLVEAVKELSQQLYILSSKKNET